MADIIHLDSLRQGRSVPVSPRTPQPNPDERIRAAADMWMTDQVLAFVENAMATTYRQPLEPKVRAKIIRMLALANPEPH